MWEILTGEFFWGIVIGLVLSLAGGWVLAKFTVEMQEDAARKRVNRFCIDTIKNMQNIITEMDKTRDRSKAIYGDFLTLIDIEGHVYSRNREHLIHLPEEVKDLVRDFMNEIATKRAEIVGKLTLFHQFYTQGQQIQVEGRGPEGQRLIETANIPLGEAQVAADKLVKLAERGSSITTKLSTLK